jgi:hypothetical protein
MGEENLYQNCCKECGIPIDSDEYGSYCPIHRLDMNGCCRNHCLIDEEGTEEHCIHCDTDLLCENCGIAFDQNFEGILNFVEMLCPDCINLRCRICGDRYNPGEGCENCYRERTLIWTYQNNTNVSTDEINHFHALYQHLAPTTEEQKQRLVEIKVQLCEECKMPCEFIWCDDCGFN